MNGVVGEVDSVHVVTKNYACLVDVEVQLTKKISQPTTFSSSICHTTIFSFSGRARDDVVTLGRP
jgi:hypothetical protein